MAETGKPVVRRRGRALLSNGLLSWVNYFRPAARSADTGQPGATAERVGRGRRSPAAAACAGEYREGAPFDPHNARRLAAVAGLVVLDGTGATLLSWVGARAALTSLGRTLDDTALPDSAFGPFGVSSLLVALVVLAFAEAFRHGRHLAEDADGLV